MLKINNLSFSYNAKKDILKNISFQLDRGEHLFVMGESGSGKSTLLKLIYGLLDASEGTLLWNNVQILGPTHNLIAGVENFKYVAQDFDLMPYTSVSENIKKFLSRFYPKKSEDRTQELLRVIEMTAFSDQKVKTLSGGQQQRVAIARALANEPELLLLDEPFSQIDNFKKSSLSRKLFAFLKEKNITCIVATHNGDEALSFADTMVVIKDNTLVANGTPLNLYKTPKLKYVASLFNDVNQLIIEGKTVLKFPHQIKIIEKSEIKATVLKSYYKGFYWLIEVKFNKQNLFINHHKNIKTGDEVWLSFKG